MYTRDQNVLGPTRALSSFLKFNFNSSTKLNKYDGHAVIKPTIPNGCFDAYEVKVKKYISKYEEEVKLISQFRECTYFSMAYQSLLHSHKIIVKILWSICIHAMIPNILVPSVTARSLYCASKPISLPLKVWYYHSYQVHVPMPGRSAI